MSSKIQSPCIRICTLNDEDCCLGCGRTLDEIKSWSGLDEQERIAVLEEAGQRLEVLLSRSPSLKRLHQSRIVE